MSDPRDYLLDLSGEPSPPADAPRAAGRPFLSVLFACCNIYQRIYRSADGRRYAGRCPGCGRSVRFVVGREGTSERFFVVE